MNIDYVNHLHKSKDVLKCNIFRLLALMIVFDIIEFTKVQYLEFYFLFQIAHILIGVKLIFLLVYYWKTDSETTEALKS